MQQTRDKRCCRGRFAKSWQLLKWSRHELTDWPLIHIHIKWASKYLIRADLEEETSELIFGEQADSQLSLCCRQMAPASQYINILYIYPGTHWPGTGWSKTELQSTLDTSQVQKQHLTVRQHGQPAGSTNKESPCCKKNLEHNCALTGMSAGNTLWFERKKLVQDVKDNGYMLLMLIFEPKRLDI